MARKTETRGAKQSRTTGQFRANGLRSLLTGTLASTAVIATLLCGVDGAGRSWVSTAEAQREGQTTSKAVSDAYFEAAELLEEENTEGAAQVIRRVLSRDELTAYEIAVMNQFLAQIYLDQEKYPEAIRALETAINTGAFETGSLAELYYFVGGLYLAVERYDDAIVALEKFFELNPNADAGANYLMAQAYAVQSRWRDSLPHAEKAVELAEAPREGYFRLLTAVYINLDDWAKAVPILERMVRDYGGKDEYWAQLASGYQTLERAEDAYAVQELRYIQGFLDRSSDIVVLADLHAFYGYPYKAANLLSRELERGVVERTAQNLERLGNYWLSAREFGRARTVLIQASRIAGSGKLDYQIGGAFAQDEEWEQAERYVASALRRGGLNSIQRANAWLLLGNARFALGRRPQALEAFRRAKGFNSTERAATQWVTFLEDQIRIERQRRLRDSIQNLIDLIDSSQTAITDLELLRDVALQARETAERARDALTDVARSRALDEFQIRNREALRLLIDQRARALRDLDATVQAIDSLEGFELDKADVEDINELRGLARQRTELVVESEDNLREAAGIIEELTGRRPDTTNVPEEPAPIDTSGLDQAPTEEEEVSEDAIIEGPAGEEADTGGEEAADATDDATDGEASEEGEEPASEDGEATGGEEAAEEAEAPAEEPSTAPVAEGENALEGAETPVDPEGVTAEPNGTDAL